MGESRIAHVLLDADGVLQHAPLDWRARLETHLGPDWERLAMEVWRAEKPALRGESDFLVGIAEVLEADGLAPHDAAAAAEDLHAALWRTIDLVPTSLLLVRRLRAAGYGVHLGTNQHAQRAAVMRSVLGYDDLFDVSVYSHAIGTKKPETAYFERAAAMIGVEPAAVLFVDDLHDNVEAARATGMAAEQWHHDQGLARLEDLLAGHGVHPAPPVEPVAPASPVAPVTP